MSGLASCAHKFPCSGALAGPPGRDLVRVQGKLAPTSWAVQGRLPRCSPPPPAPSPGLSCVLLRKHGPPHQIA